jgi:hypothetical protein
MKNKLNIFYVIAFSLFIFSCSNSNNEEPIGQWDDIIKLSTKEAAFKSNGDSITIKTQGEWWWIAEISVDKNEFYDFSGIDILSDNYSIKQDCFVVERLDKNTLFIKLNENPTNVERIVVVTLQAGNYFDRVIITQDPK